MKNPGRTAARVYLPMLLLAYMSSGLELLAQERPRSISSDTPVNVEFINESDAPVELHWIDYEGNERPGGLIPSGDTHRIESYATHPFVVRDPETKGRIMLFVVGRERSQTFYITPRRGGVTFAQKNGAFPLSLAWSRHRDWRGRRWSSSCLGPALSRSAVWTRWPSASRKRQSWTSRTPMVSCECAFGCQRKSPRKAKRLPSYGLGRTRRAGSTVPSRSCWRSHRPWNQEPSQRQAQGRLRLSDFLSQSPGRLLLTEPRKLSPSGVFGGFWSSSCSLSSSPYCFSCGGGAPRQLRNPSPSKRRFDLNPSKPGVDNRYAQTQLLPSTLISD